MKCKKKLFYPLTDYAPSGVAQTPSGKAQPYLPHDTPRVPRSVHAKFHADRTKTVGARGIHTYIHRYIDSPSVTVALS